ncbi:MAG: helix-turn-helix domain-containing protein [Erysipelothrix sp.]|nr:helix-turn-helix domain-containing protein [Erysipelothrix sp.]
MKYAYKELVWGDGLAVKVTIHSVVEFKMYCHKEIELLLVMKGRLDVGVGDKSYHLDEDDIILINSNQLHTVKNATADNVILRLEISPGFYSGSFIDMQEVSFNSIYYDHRVSKSKEIAQVREIIAKMVFAMENQEEGYRFKVGSYLYLLGETLLKNFAHKPISKTNEFSESYMARLQRIIDFVNENYKNNITLKDIAKKENLNYFYLSHFIKEKLGVSFKDYLNSVRLNKALRLLLDGDETIIEISNQSGFPNISSFNAYFKKELNMTPTEYRKSDQESDECKKYYGPAEDFNRQAALEKLQNYIDIDTNQTIIEDPKDVHERVLVDFQQQGTLYKKHWNKLTTFGRAKEGLGANWQRQFSEFQKEFNFEYVRFHGIFADDMKVMNIDDNQEIYYNWDRINELFDYFYTNDIKPFIELSYFPDLLKSSDKTVFEWKANMSLPNDLDLWGDLLNNFLNHVIERYGIKQVNTWYFELWTPPDFDENFDSDIVESQFEYFNKTVKTIKSVSKDIKVGGPAISKWSLSSGTWYVKFLDYVSKAALEIDFLSMHVFSENLTTDSLSKIKELVAKQASNKDLMQAARSNYHPKNHLVDTIKRIDEAKDEYLDNELEMHITQWGFSPITDNLVSDTSFYATNIIKTMLDTIGLSGFIGYWTFSDLIEDYGRAKEHFFGGLGLINKEGIKKPSYNAFLLLSKLGDELVTLSENYVVTKKNDDIQILIYNHANLSDDFLLGSIEDINLTDRYSIYNPKQDLKVEVFVENITGKFKVTKYQLDRENGSAFDEWVNIGAPTSMSLEEVNYLKAKDSPNISVKFKDIKENFSKIIHVPVHGVQMILLEKIT